VKTALSTALVGVETGPLAQRIDARWLMAYAAALGERDPRYFDTESEHGPTAHPMFPVCYEWPAALAIRARTIPDAIGPLSVHASHHMVVARLLRAGDTVLTTARVIGVRRRKAGTLVITRFTTVDEHGADVTRTDYGSVYRGVPADGDVLLESVATEPMDTDSDIAWTEMLDIHATAAHVYTECARIWNPIHTDIAVARAAGLPGLILHGTATLALAVSRVLVRDLGGDPAQVKEIAARFTGMVRLPSRLNVRRRGRRDGAIVFDTVDEEGRSVLAAGVVRA
jgi:acyl dehydratase